MVDLYALPSDFPGNTDCRGYMDPIQRVKCLEARFQADIEDRRFIPYIQLHAKPAAGPLIVHHIGVATLRRECHHFDEWLAQLQQCG